MPTHITQTPHTPSHTQHVHVCTPASTPTCTPTCTRCVARPVPRRATPSRRCHSCLLPTLPLQRPQRQSPGKMPGRHQGAHMAAYPVKHQEAGFQGRSCCLLRHLPLQPLRVIITKPGRFSCCRLLYLPAPFVHYPLGRSSAESSGDPGGRCCDTPCTLWPCDPSGLSTRPS